MQTVCAGAAVDDAVPHAVVVVVHHRDCVLPPPASEHATWQHCPLERTPAERGRVGSASDDLRLPAAAGNSSSELTHQAPRSRH